MSVGIIEKRKGRRKSAFLASAGLRITSSLHQPREPPSEPRQLREPPLEQRQLRVAQQRALERPLEQELLQPSDRTQRELTSLQLKEYASFWVPQGIVIESSNFSSLS
jgi:hypothetical protein